jgi:hypothetical protein
MFADIDLALLIASIHARQVEGGNFNFLFHVRPFCSFGGRTSSSFPPPSMLANANLRGNEHVKHPRIVYNHETNMRDSGRKKLPFRGQYKDLAVKVPIQACT